MIRMFPIVAALCALALPAEAGPTRTVADYEKFSAVDGSGDAGTVTGLHRTVADYDRRSQVDDSGRHDIIEGLPVGPIDDSKLDRGRRGSRPQLPIDVRDPLFRVLRTLWSVGFLR